MKPETEFPRTRFSAYWTEALGAEIKARVPDSYPIECHSHSEDFAALQSAVNQGIDAHLEAIFFSQGAGDHGRVRLDLEPRSVPVLVRRLLESGDDAAQSLASSICETLNIDLV